MSADPTIVATSRSRSGGYCGRCGGPIVSGEPIVKIWDGRPGHQTSAGQGPGIWVCADCAAHAAD